MNQSYMGEWSSADPDQDPSTVALIIVKWKTFATVFLLDVMVWPNRVTSQEGSWSGRSLSSLQRQSNQLENKLLIGTPSIRPSW